MGVKVDSDFFFQFRDSVQIPRGLIFARECREGSGTDHEVGADLVKIGQVFAEMLTILNGAKGELEMGDPDGGFSGNKGDAGLFPEP